MDEYGSEPKSLEGDQRNREETLTASVQTAQTIIAKLQALKALPYRSWSKRILGEIETVYVRDHFGDRRSEEVLRKQGHWIGRRRSITFEWHTADGVTQVSCTIRLEQGFHDPNTVPNDPEHARPWAPAYMWIEGFAPNGGKISLSLQEYENIKTLLALAENKPLFE